jgi:sulfotransferase family protein
VSELYDKYGQRKGKSIVGDKTPTYVRKIPILASLWPRARFVHLIRDGRDVWLSMRNWRMADKAAGGFTSWKVDPVVTTALWWKALVGIGCQDGASLESCRYRSVYYERLVTESEHECRLLAEFFALPYDPKMSRYFEGHTIHSESGSANRDWLPPTPGLRNWRTQMESSAIECFEAAAGDMLQQLGYELACTKIGRIACRRMEQVKSVFTAEAQQRRWRLPDRW